MNEKSRVSNSIKNVKVTLIVQMVSYIMVFISRTVFVYLLGNDYLSLNGLFSNVITLLSFTDLGIGSAVVYCLYKPIADNNQEKIRTLIQYFKRIYDIVTIVVLILGVCIIPFLKYMVDLDTVNGIAENIYIIYYMFVINTAFSYILTYKKSFLIACQKNYIVNEIFYTVYIIEMLIQVILLVITHNYILYLSTQLVGTLLTNIITGIYVDRNYPELHGGLEVQITKAEKKEIADNVSSMFLYKIGSVILNGTDNIIISTVLKTAYVGLCSNYILIINAISNTVNMCFNSIAASVGNLTATEPIQKQEKIFYQLDMLTFLVFAFCSICLGVMLNPLIGLWFGKRYLLPQSVVLALVASFYFTGINQAAYLFRTATGLFKQTKIYPFLGAILNIVLSVGFAKYMGLAGVFVATAIVRLLCFSFVDSRLIFKQIFCKSSRKYYITFVVRLFVLGFGYFIVNILLINYPVNDIITLFIRTIFCGLLALGYLLLWCIWNPTFLELISRVFNIKK